MHLLTLTNLRMNVRFINKLIVIKRTVCKQKTTMRCHLSVIKTACLINIESALNIALRVDITIRILIKLNFIFMTWSSLLLESGIHFGADTVKKINDFLVVLLPTILFDLKSLSYVVERLRKV